MKSLDTKYLLSYLRNAMKFIEDAEMTISYENRQQFLTEARKYTEAATKEVAKLLTTTP